MTIDPRLQMFISTCCISCRDTNCPGALSAPEKRDACKTYLKWLKLPKDKQSKLFMRAMAEEVINLENIIEE